MEERPLGITVRYEDGMGGHLQGSVMNISLGGMYIRTAYPLPRGVLALLELADTTRGTMAKISGMVIRADASRGMALEFVDKGNSGVKDLLRGLGIPVGMVSPDTHDGENRRALRLQVLSNDYQVSNKKKREKSHGESVKKEKRRHSRKLLRIEARYQDPDSRVLKGILRNISLSGLYIETANTLDAQTKLHMSLDATDLGKVIDVAGRVIRTDEKKGMAIEFEDKDNREIRLLLSSLRKLDQASMLSLIRSSLGD
jgi:hypothetical protein